MAPASQVVAELSGWTQALAARTRALGSSFPTATDDTEVAQAMFAAVAEGLAAHVTRLQAVAR